MAHIAFLAGDVQFFCDKTLENGGSKLGELVEKKIEGVGILSIRLKNGWTFVCAWQSRHTYGVEVPCAPGQPEALADRQGVTVRWGLEGLKANL